MLSAAKHTYIIQNNLVFVLARTNTFVKEILCATLNASKSYVKKKNKNRISKNLEEKSEREREKRSKIEYLEDKT